MNTENKANHYKGKDVFLFILYSAIGIFMFFIPIKVNGTSSIPLDHIVSFFKTIPNYNLFYGLFMVIAGVIYSLRNKKWMESTSGIIFFLLKLLALVFAFLFVTKTGPAALHEPSMLPLIWNAILVSVATIVPIGSIFLGFITNFGLMEFIGVYMEKIMRPIWKTPGRSAVDAVASFVGSYSLALLITNRVYGEKRYTTREAAIIATGFSTVSATFMIIVAKTLGIMDQWLLYFALTAVITFLVTAITVHIYPLSKKPDTYIDGSPAIVENNDVKDAFMSDINIKETFKWMGRCNIILAGIGELKEDTYLIRDKDINKKYKSYFLSKNAVGDIGFRWYDLNGQPIVNEYENKTIGYNILENKNNALIVAIAGGERKYEAILGALRGGFLDVLVTDEDTAKRLIQL